MAEHDSIFIDPPSPYGYRVNVSHPLIGPLYRRYKAWKGIPYSFPMTDQERFEFEEYILRAAAKKGLVTVSPPDVI